MKVFDAEYRKALWERLQTKYLVQILREETLEESLNFRLTRLNVYVFFSTLVVVVCFFTVMAIVVTPIKEYIPGYMDVNMRDNVLKLSYAADSLSGVVKNQDLLIKDIQSVLSGETEHLDAKAAIANANNESEMDYKEIKLSGISKEDSLMREEVEQGDVINLDEGGENVAERSLYLIKPIEGILMQEFDFKKEHFGVDITGKEGEPIKAVADGIVFFTSWTMETGHVIGIQHEDNLVSFYKHNSVLLKKTGIFVNSGDVIALMGSGGELSTGPHLHFELWHHQKPVNPKDYVSFN